MAKTYRDQWRKAKAEAAKQFDMSKVADKQNFGPKLDKYDAAVTAYEKVMKSTARKPDEAKENAAKKALMAAAREASTAGANYLQALTFIEKNTTGPAKDAAEKLTTVLSMDILRTLNKVAKGDVAVAG